MGDNIMEEKQRRIQVHVQQNFDLFTKP